MGAGSVPNSSTATPSDVPDVLAPGLDVVFCGINPGRVSATAGAHFANPRNDFWRLLHDAGFTPRLFEPEEQFALLDLAIGMTNAAYRTTKGSGDLRRADFADSSPRLERVARELRPRAIAFVGKEAYRGAFGTRTELGIQARILVDTGLFVLPSTSPANAAVPYDDRLRWFRKLREWVSEPPIDRPAVRALILDHHGRTLLVRWPRPGGSAFWVTPGGGIEPGESDHEALSRELGEELGAPDLTIGPCLWTREFTFPWRDAWYRQRERHYLVRAEPADLRIADTIDDVVDEHRWWTADEIAASDELFAPARLAELLRGLAANGPPPTPIDVGP
jgi:double-stranded uracil-DNA glycosylase